jgi:predicted MFS family arabinose efflux permease
MDGQNAGVKSAAERLGVSEGRMLLLVASVQFVNILDFMMVMPLGPDFAKELAIPMSSIGLIGGSYTAAAAISGIIAARFLDRFDRRPALAVTLLGLVVATALGGLAQGMYSLMAARILAGAFGGPATSLALSIVADVVPPDRRGRALGIVMGAFSVASVLGVPAGLELARIGTWRLPFFAVAGLGLVVAALATFMMPKLVLHLGQTRAFVRRPFVAFVREPAVFLALSATVSVTLAAFSVIPNLSAYIQHNLGYPRDELGILYLAGGTVSFVTMRVVGSQVDKLGAPLMSAIGTVVFMVTLLPFLTGWRGAPVMGIFIGFMSATALRNVSMSTLTSRVPAPHERARFMSTQSAAQHLASATGAVLSSQLLSESPDHELIGMPAVATFSIACSVCLPFLLALCERRVVINEQQRA